MKGNRPKNLMGESFAIVRAKILRWKSGAPTKRRSDDLAREEPLEIRVRGKAVSVTMRTPGHDFELAAGFLVTEGLIRKREDVVEIAFCQRTAAPAAHPSPDGFAPEENDQNILNVFLAPSVECDFEKLTRHVFASSSCGICGKATIDAVHQHFEPLPNAERGTRNTEFEAKKILPLPEKLRAAQKTFERTGGLHAAAIFDQKGKLLVLREDVGRHNAVDKVIGHGFLNNRMPFDSHILMVSGRASFEIMQKALAARIPVVVAVSAPSSLAVEFARESGQTLVGFLRGRSMNIYTHPGRILP